MPKGNTKNSALHRRKLLQGLAGGASLSVAGCIGDGTTTDTTGGSDGGEQSDTPTPTPVIKHDVAETIYVAPDGSENGDGSEGSPYATMVQARDHLRSMDFDSIDGDVSVEIAAGDYDLSEPISLTDEDSGTEETAVIYRGDSKGETRIHGSRKLDLDWSTTTVNGVEAWKATVDDVANGDWTFNQLFVNGERRHRPRFPESIDDSIVDDEIASKDDFYYVIGGPEAHGDNNYTDGDNIAFVEDGVIDPEWRNFGDIDMVAHHRWFQERLPLVDYEETEENNELTVQFRQAYLWTLVNANFYLENVFEALSKPGQWYLDSNTGELFYIPKPGESPDTVTVRAPVITELLQVAGDNENDAPVQNLHFEGLTFSGTAFENPGQSWGLQGSIRRNMTDAVRFRDAINISVRNCKFKNLGANALKFTNGTRNGIIHNNHLSEIGSQGIVIADLNGGLFGDYLPADIPDHQKVGDHDITNNHIHHNSRRIMGNAMELIYTDHNRVAHNHVHHNIDVGIDLNAVPSYRRANGGVTVGNVIEDNYIHDLGNRFAKEFAGIYCTGVMPETTVRRNFIHDVLAKDGHLGCGFYWDLAASNITATNNIILNCDISIFNHYGHSDIFRNNLLAFPGDGGHFGLGDATEGEDDVPSEMIIENNIMVGEGSPLYTREAVKNTDVFMPDNNLIWDYSGEITAWKDDDTSIGIEEWQELGQDTNSVIENPNFEAPHQWRFGLPEDSPARSSPVNFEPINMEELGPTNWSMLAPPNVWGTLNSDGSITVEWTEVPNASKYSLFRAEGDGNFEELASDLEEYTYQDSAVDIGNYHYTLRASDGQGLTSPQSLPVVVNTNPAPSGLTASRIDNGIELDWEPTPVADAYRILRAPSDSGSFTQIESDVSDPAYTDSTAEFAASYRYAVVAITAGGDESERAVVSVSDPTKLSTPSELTYWDSKEFPVAQGVTTDGPPFRFNEVIDGNLWANDTAGGNLHVEDGLGTEATIVAELNEQFNSAPIATAGIIVRNDITETGDSDGYSYPDTVGLVITPESGIVLMGGAQGESEREHWFVAEEGPATYPTWLKLTKDGTTFAGYYKLPGDEAWKKLGEFSLSVAESVQDFGLNVGGQTGWAQGGTVEFSLFQHAATVLEAENVGGELVLTPPASLEASRTDSGIDLTWADAPGADGYTIYRSQSGEEGSFEQITDEPIAETSYTDSDVGSSAYYYTITTIGPDGNESNRSDVISAPAEAKQLGSWKTFTTTNAAGEFESVEDGIPFTISGKGYIANEYNDQIDEYSVVFQDDALDGAGSITVDIESLNGPNYLSKAGIMVRNDITKPGESLGYVGLFAKPHQDWNQVKDYILGHDSNGNGFLKWSNADLRAGTSEFPSSLKLEKDGTTFTGYFRISGSWTKIGSVDVPDAAETQDVGVFFDSHSDTVGSATFSSFSLH